MTTKGPVPTLPDMTLEDIHRAVSKLIVGSQSAQGQLGREGGGENRGVTFRDLYDLGLIDASTLSRISRRG